MSLLPALAFWHLGLTLGEKGREEKRLWERSETLGFEGPLIFNLKDSVHQGFLLEKTLYSELQQGFKKRLEHCDVQGLSKQGGGEGTVTERHLWVAWHSFCEPCGLGCMLIMSPCAGC